MLMLLFRVGNEPWALAAADVKDLVPSVTLQPFTCPDSSGFVGLLNYHGDRIPVADVSALLGYPRAAQIMSTRIAIVELPADGTASTGGVRLGLILDQAYETADLSEKVILPIPQAHVQEMYKDSQDQVVRRFAISPLLYPNLKNRQPLGVA